MCRWGSTTRHSSRRRQLGQSAQPSHRTKVTTRATYVSLFFKSIIIKQRLSDSIILNIIFVPSDNLVYRTWTKFKKKKNVSGRGKIKSSACMVNN